jgi:hypothetical protein
MPMIDYVAETLVGESQEPGRASDASAGSVQGPPDQFTLTLVYLFFKGTLDGCSLRLRDRRVRDSKPSAGTQTRRAFRIQLFSQPFISLPVQVSDFSGREKVFEFFENGKEHASSNVEIPGRFSDMGSPLQKAER